MTPSEMNRRTFLLSIPPLFAALLGLRSMTALAGDSKLPAGKKAILETDTTATALKYKHDATKAEGAKKDQRCDNCFFYTEENASWGKCQILPSGLVQSKGWCASWTKKTT